ncbi:MAG: hypothetical protein HC920_04720 [Oscillatoriales cyanobacterium SM2_3_0]|nr:hypothetical protein [Oscillatoriales cyanobacterium SM2_3_0]
MSDKPESALRKLCPRDAVRAGGWLAEKPFDPKGPMQKPVNFSNILFSNILLENILLENGLETLLGN